MTCTDDLLPLERVRTELARRGHDWDMLRIIQALGTAGFRTTSAFGSWFVYQGDGRASVETCADECQRLEFHDFSDEAWLSEGVVHEDGNFTMH